MIHEHLFRNPTTKEHADLIEHVLAVVAVAILFGQTHRDTQSTTTRDDGDFVHWVTFGQELADQGMARLVVGRVAALLFGHDHAFALRAHQNFVFGFLKVHHLDHASVSSSRHQGRFIAQIGQISATHARGATGNDTRCHVLADGHFSHVHIQNLLSAANVGQGHIHLSIKTTWAQKGCVQNIWAIGGGHHNDPQIRLKTIHLHEHLVQGLFTLVIAPTQASTTLATHGINFVNENDTRRVLFGVFEHVAHASRAHADKHFHKIRTRDAKKRHLGLTSDALGEQCFTGSWRPHEEQTTRNAATELLKALRIFQKVHHFLHLFFGLVATGDIGKGDGVVVLVEHARFALAETKGTPLATALHLAHEIDPDSNEQQHGAPTHQEGHQ